MARKRKSKPTGRRRREEQRVKDRLAHAQDDAQRLGVIPTRPEEALKSARVDPSSQDEQRFPGLDRAAIRNSEGWGVPEPVKRRVIEKSAEVLYERRVAYDKEGREIELPPDRAAEAQATKTLIAADKFQHEVDHPEEAGKARGGSKVDVNVGVQVVNQLQLFHEAARQIEDDEIEDRIAEAKDDPAGSSAVGAGVQGVLQEEDAGAGDLAGPSDGSDRG